MEYPTAHRSPWSVAVHPSGAGESAVWTRETIADAFADVAQFSRLAVEHQKPVLITVRDRGGMLVHQVVTVGYVSAVEHLPGVPS